MKITHCVIRVFPGAMFFEEYGTKRQCMEYANKAAKPRLRVCKVTPIVSWDEHGKKRFVQIPRNESEVK